MAGRKIVVTGVSKGLGRALLDEFAGLGHFVAGCARNAKQINALQKDYAAPHHFAVADVASDTSVEAWSQAVLDDFGVPDLLINNAGTINANAPLWDVPAEEFRTVMDVNVNGVHSVIRHLLPAMMDAGEGVIVNVSSGWGRSVSPDVAPYCASKWAVEGLTRALAEELPEGMAAVPVNPGVIHTELLESCFGDGAAMAGKPDAWAKAAAPFLLGLSARDNGQSLTCP